MVILKSIALSLGKFIAVLAALAALASRFTSCLLVVYQPRMPEKIRDMKGAGSILNHQ
ncbi:MAG: cyclic lactone autoinducer peptide [Clostridiaceae bacterium]|nr:cyclic lactone autoinducer peptide [Clostridiaceae bacterium]